MRWREKRFSVFIRWICSGRQKRIWKSIYKTRERIKLFSQLTFWSRSCCVEVLEFDKKCHHTRLPIWVWPLSVSRFVCFLPMVDSTSRTSDSSANNGLNWKRVSTWISVQIVVEIDHFRRFSEMPNGQVPTLEVDGKVMYQSLAVCRYLSTIVGLNGANAWENYEIDNVVDTMNDYRQSENS